MNKKRVTIFYMDLMIKCMDLMVKEVTFYDKLNIKEYNLHKYDKDMISLVSIIEFAIGTCSRCITFFTQIHIFLYHFIHF